MCIHIYFLAFLPYYATTINKASLGMGSFVSQTIGFVYLTLISENDCELTATNFKNIIQKR